jgi:CRISPR-associated protein (TIGR02710 family)
MTEVSSLLICTVGGSPEPIVATLKQWRPARVLFVHTPQTRDDIETTVIPKARDEDVALDPGRYDLFELPDGQDLAGCLDHLRSLTPDVTAWAARGAAFQIVVDFTGGTKCMSVALGIQASRWPCMFSYVGGNERTKDGVGVVVSGAEKIVHETNPWDALGYQAVGDYVVLFDQHAFLAAANIASVTMRQVSRPDHKRELAVLEQLAKALDAWDRFNHATSKNLLDGVAKSANDLRAVLGSGRGDRILDGATRLAAHLGQICQATPPSRHHVLDLLSNAKRRKDEGRLDDAVARLYRAIEAMAQVALKDRHGIEGTEKVSLDRVPESLRTQWASRLKDGVVALGLQDAYALLRSLNDPLGQKFNKTDLDGPESPLTARNRSILAHGFDQVSARVFDKLWTAALFLADIMEMDLPSFPSVGEPPKG